MALPFTMHHIQLELADVDRGVYETFDLRLARHPSETVRYMLVRLLAYALSYEDGIAFSKEGLSNSDEPPLTVRDPTGLLLAWIDVGMPSADRLHKASKAARRVALFTTGDLALLRKDAKSRPIHKVEAIEVWPLPPQVMERLEAHAGRDVRFTLTRSEGTLYVTVGGETVEAPLVCERLSE